MLDDKKLSREGRKEIKSGLTMVLVGFVIAGLSGLLHGQSLIVIASFFWIFGIISVKNVFSDDGQAVRAQAEVQEKEHSDSDHYDQEDVPTHLSTQEVQQKEQGIAQPPSSLPYGHVEEKGSSWAKKLNWEEWVGQKLLQKLGVMIVLIGMAVFLKYSFDNGWIGMHGRIAMSTLAACALLFAGEWFQKQYPKWFQAFTGGGLALLYFTVWATHVFYAGKLVVEITPLMASILYGAITLIGALAAIRYKAQTIAWFTVAGGYVTPMLIEGVANPMGFVVYLAILAVGLIILAWHQKWRYLNIVAFILTQGYLAGKIYSLPIDAFTDVQQIAVASGFFLLFGLLPFFYQFRVGTPTELDDILLIIGNGLAVFLPIFDAVGGIDSQYTSFVCLALAAFYLGYAGLSLNKVSKDGLLINTYLVGAVILVALAIYVELEAEWVAAGWAPFSALLVYTAVRLQLDGPWKCAVLLLAGSMFFLGLQTPGIYQLNSETLWQPFVSRWSLQSYVVFASLILWLLQSNKLPQKIANDEVRKSAHTSLHVLMAVLMFLFLAFNALAYGVPTIDWTIDMVLTIALLLFVVVAMVFFLMTGVIVWLAAAFLAQAFILVSVFVLAEGSGMLAFGSAVAITPLFHPWAGVSVVSFFLTLGLCYTALARPNIKKNAPRLRMMLLSVALAQVWVHLSVEIHHFAQALEWGEIIFSRVLGAWWIVFAVALRQWGLWKPTEGMAKAGTLLLIPVLLKDFGMLLKEQNIYLYEIIQWTVVPLALAMQAAKRNDVLSLKWNIAYLGIFAFADMFILTSFSVSGQGFLRTTWWAIAALATICLGFSEQQQLLRKVGIGLFFATAAKLLVFDFAALSTGVRIAASIVMGLMMIGASYLYQRFGSPQDVHLAQGH